VTSAPVSPGADLEDARARYVDALSRSSMRDAVRLVADLAGSGVPLDRIVGQVLAPAQVEVGRMWEIGRWSVAQEHTATGITEVALQTAVLSAGVRMPDKGQPSMVLACADGEWHSLSARMAADVLRAEGVDVTYVGASLPSESLGDFLAVQAPTALGLSCSTAMTLVGARETVTEAHAVGVPVIVAGSAFGSHGSRAEAIGADAWVAEPVAAVEVLRAWTAEPPATFRAAVDPGTEEWQTLAVAPTDWVDDVMLRLSRRRPRLHSQGRALEGRLRKEAAYLLRCASGVQLTRDEGILEEYTAWLRGVMTARKVPVDLVDDLYAGAVEALAERAPQAAAMLDRSRVLLRSHG
jgi:methanogenic corrinoid protein MtbC1